MSRRICRLSLGGAAADVAADPWARLFDRDDDLDLDRDPGRQRAHADRRACMPARLAKDFDKEVRAAVYDFGMILEIGCGIDHAQHLDDPLDPVEIAAQRLLDYGDQHEADLAGMAIALLDRHPGAELSPRHRAGGALRALAREIQQIPDPPGVDVIPERAADVGQRDVQFLQPLLDAHPTISAEWRPIITEKSDRRGRSAAAEFSDLDTAALLVRGQRGGPAGCSAVPIGHRLRGGDIQLVRIPAQRYRVGGPADGPRRLIASSKNECSCSEANCAQ